MGIKVKTLYLIITADCHILIGFILCMKVILTCVQTIMVMFAHETHLHTCTHVDILLVDV